MYEDSHECTKCSDPASVHMAVSTWRQKFDRESSGVCVTSASVPLPLQCWLQTLLSFQVRGHISSSYQPTNGIYLVVTGLAVKMVRVGKRCCLTTPQHGHLGSCRDGLSFHLPPPKGSWDPWLEVTELLPCLAVVTILKWSWGPGVSLLLGTFASSRSSLNVFWHPSESRPCTKRISELILWGDKIMRIVLPKIMKYRIMSAYYHWIECIFRKLNVTKTHDIFGNCMLSSNFVWIFIQALFYELYKMF